MIIFGELVLQPLSKITAEFFFFLNNLYNLYLAKPNIIEKTDILIQEKQAACAQVKVNIDR